MDNLFAKLFPDFTIDWNEIAYLFQFIKIPAKTTLLHEGDVATNIYFVSKGALRLWNNDNGNDITVQFFFEDQVVSSFESFYLETPSNFSIESLEETELYMLRKKDLDFLLKKEPEMNVCLTKFISERFMAYTHYFLSRIKESPEERYIHLIQSEPFIFDRVPNYYIASYLGITPVSLSRIRKRIEKKTA
ncbi:cyclic nucleotide-binding domain-containing protein [Listeria floridensis FSL S10-1187]|uniref:Cyclic nucleotide-binding domain-containing protein n=1 Tax=Listeria floridensis FSL S10-1187 TaxID=1265817 RepID=A0ABP3AZX9_9LIST|nr:Crp/Fnr family transcriptional regulator [Listeria floridensis]EUJ33169.1 cyclic nucleotide-binding domain-containing protein [Listeria floridensis FSL S10-1187]